MKFRISRITWPAAYVAAIVAANVLTERLGLIPVGFGLMATAGTWAAGAVIVSRNLSQDSLGRGRVIALMTVGIVLSWWLSSAQLATASAVAFMISETTDMLVYTPLRARGRSRAVLIASAIAGVADTYVFLWLAGFPLTAADGQLFVKTLVAFAASVILSAVSRDNVKPAGA